jgi:tetratricopeptide (TPR) repeat protein
MVAIRNIFLVLVLVCLTAGCKDYSNDDKKLPSDLGKELMQKIEKGEYDEVSDYLNHLVEARPYSNNGFRLLEEIYVYMSRQRGKNDLWDEWCRQRDGCHSAFIVRGLVHIHEAWRARGGDFGYTVSEEWGRLFRDELILAGEDLHEAWQLNPKDPNSAGSMITVCMGLKMGEEAMEEWFHRAVEADPQSVYPYLSKLTYLSPKWRGQGSDEKFTRFAYECTQNPQGGISNYAVLYSFLKENAERSRDEKSFYNEPRVKAALDQLFDRWLKAFPNSTTARNDQASIQYRLKNWGGGIRYADETLRIDPENVVALNTRGLCYYYASNPGAGYQRAEKDFQKIIEIDPYHDTAYYVLGMIATEVHKDYKKAVEFYDKAISLNDRSKEYFFGRGKAKFLLGDYEEAVNDLNRAIAIDSKYAEAYRGREQCLRKLNRIQEAEADSQKLNELIANDKTKDFLAAFSRGDTDQYIKSNRYINLSAVNQIPLELAERLSFHEGILYLNGLETLEPEMAKLLCKQKGHLHLEGLKSITPKVAEFLGQHDGNLYLNGLVELSPEIAASLGSTLSGLELNGLKTISPDTASVLSHSKMATLSLNGLENISPEVAAAFAGFKGELRLDGLSSISIPLAAQLGKREGGIWLSGLKSLDPVSAKHLAKCRRSLNLSGLETISAETAAALAEHQGILTLYGLKSLSPQVAEKLAACPGRLDLAGIERVTPEAAAGLRKHKGDLFLGITTITADVARELSGYQGKLWLSNLKVTDPEILAILDQHKGVENPHIRLSQ